VLKSNERAEESRARNTWCDIAVNIGRIRVMVDKWFGWVEGGDKIRLCLYVVIPTDPGGIEFAHIMFKGHWFL
jgi:hypothetical protein